MIDSVETRYNLLQLEDRILVLQAVSALSLMRSPATETMQSVFNQLREDLRQIAQDVYAAHLMGSFKP